MKFAILICGPESSGTGYIKTIFEELFNTKEKYGDFVEQDSKLIHKDVNNKDVNNKDVNNKDVNNKDVNNKDVYSLNNLKFEELKGTNKSNKEQCWKFKLVTHKKSENLYYIKHIGVPFGNFYPNIPDFVNQLEQQNFNVKVVIPIRNHTLSTKSTIRRFNYDYKSANIYKEISKIIINKLLNTLPNCNILSFDSLLYLKEDYLKFFLKQSRIEVDNIDNIKLDIKNIDSKYLTDK